MALPIIISVALFGVGLIHFAKKAKRSHRRREVVAIARECRQYRKMFSERFDARNN